MDKTPHPVDVYVGARIAARRIALGLNQSDLGRALGLTFQQIQKYEKGANRVSASKLHATAAYLGVSISHFFEGLPDLVDDGAEASVPSFWTTKLGHQLNETMSRLPDEAQRAIARTARDFADLISPRESA